MKALLQMFKGKSLSIVTIIYSLILFYFVFLYNTHLSPYPYWDHITNSINIIPFSTISTFINRFLENTINDKVIINNLVGNLLMFVPLGFFLMSYKKKRILSVILDSMLLIASKEIVQLFFTIGSFDIDDIILNMCGTLCGIGIFKIVYLIVENNRGNTYV